MSTEKSDDLQSVTPDETSRTEFFLKTGVILLGASINLVNLVKIGVGGIIQSVILDFPRIWRVGEEKFGTMQPGEFSGQISWCEKS
jgi:hypothetical protein